MGELLKTQARLSLHLNKMNWERPKIRFIDFGQHIPDFWRILLTSGAHKLTEDQELLRTPHPKHIV